MNIRKSAEQIFNRSIRALVIIVPLVAIVGIALVFTMSGTRTSEESAPAVSKPWKWERPAKKLYPMVKGEASDRLPAEQAVEEAAPVVEAKPYRTFITLQNYQIENNGEGPKNPISNVRLEVKFPVEPGLDENGEPKKDRLMVNIPRGGEYWPIGNGQMVEINQTFEIPFDYLQKDGFELQIQMDRKGAWIKPCIFRVKGLSQFNRKYICRVDEKWQLSKGVTEENLDKEAIEIRVFTDLHPLPKDKAIPKDVIAIR